MKKILIFFMLFMSFTQIWGSNIDISNKSTWLQLLHNKEYDVLDIELSKLQKDYENNASTEGVLSFALSSFENSDPELEYKLEQWLSAKPDSEFSHLALGLYHSHLGWLSRGSRWSKDTTSQQFAKMKGHFRKANDELRWVVKQNPKQSIAYGDLINLASAEGDSVAENTFFSEAIKYSPLSSVIRRAYLSSLLPKWGGSFAKIEKFLSETTMLYNQNPALKIQEGYLEYARGDEIIIRTKDNKSYKNALEYLNKAIEKSKYSLYLGRRADVYKYMKSYEKSINDYTKALNISPQNSRYLAAKGSVYYKLKKYSLAIENIDEAIKFDKMNPRALRTRGLIYYSMKEKDKALIDLLDSLVYGFENYTTHVYLGYIYYYTKKNYRLAAESLKLSSKFGNDDSYIWYLITASQWHNRDCEFVESADIYAQKCKESGKCKKKNLDWALKSAAYAKRSTCKK
ncbi:MAG: hypothetical protein DRQ78_03820 [Epsilonproteobacteria bacterium]|nr:MAG: hypothetical protein DRQ78_03820 [Campylobacterota bacterium]